MSPAVVVIDMQPGFANEMYEPYISKPVRRAWQKKLKGIQHAVKTARNKGWKIIFVEYKGMGRTIGPISKLVKGLGPKRVMTVVKNQDDGSRQVRKAMRALKVDRVYLTGCNADACVLATWGGLTNYGSVPHSYVYLPGVMSFNDHSVRCHRNSFIADEYYNGDPRAAYRLGKKIRNVPEPDRGWYY